MIPHLKPVMGAVTALVLALLALAGGSFGAVSATAGLAFVRDAREHPQVWVAAPNGSGARELANGSDPTLSPNGAMVAAVVAQSGGRFGFEILKVSGGTVTLPAAFRNGSFYAAAWSPGSRYLAITEQDSVTARSGPGNAAIDVIDATTGRETLHISGVPNGATFGPGTPDTLVYSVARSLALSAATNLYARPADGSGTATQLTHNNRSAYPVWGSKGMAFDLITPRGNGEAPVYQIALLKGSTITQITHTHPNGAVDGLAPDAIAANGVDLVTNFVGTDTGQAYSVNLASHKVTKLIVGHQMTGAYGISRNGTRVLVSYGAFEEPTTPVAKLATIPFRGGRPTVLLSNASEPSWNQ